MVAMRNVRVAYQNLAGLHVRLVSLLMVVIGLTLIAQPDHASSVGIGNMDLGPMETID